MAPFYPLYIRRSDGKQEIKSKSGKELNQPVASQLDTKPNAQGISDFYRECPAGDSKEVDWRRKLAGMLVREINPMLGREKNFVLACLPENYRLFEHIKCKYSEIDGKPQKITKNHAGGANERQDAYLYGHPHGRRKRYRSPAEFFPHLFWLCTDETGDTNNCSCKFCSPEEVEAEEKPLQKSLVKDVKQEPLARTSTSTPPILRRPSSQQSAHPPSQSLNEATQLARPRSLEQARDAQYNKFYYRLGELVWFARGPAWGLGALIWRDEVQTFGGTQLQYRVQPLSHPYVYPSTVNCLQTQLRPWLAWSPPNCTSPALNPSPENSNKVFTFESVNWQNYLRGAYGRGDAEVDASILSAKAVERTYTFLDRIDAKTSTPGNGQTSEIYYNGIFLGAEKFWIGDPVRLRNPSSPTDILILHSIIEKTQPDKQPQVVFVGDTYALQQTNINAASISQNEVYLPLRVREDLRARNTITATNEDPAKRTSIWRLQGKSVKMGIADIKGRWYESSIFIPIMDASKYEENRRAGEMGDAGLWMNGLGDCNRPPGGPIRSFKPADIKVRKREEAFGRSVPKEFIISKGLDESRRPETADAVRNLKTEDRAGAYAPGRSQLPTQSHQMQQQQQQQQSLSNPYAQTVQQPLQQEDIGGTIQQAYGSIPVQEEANFDEYMNLDDVDDDQAGTALGEFAQQYEQFYPSDQLH